MGTSLQKQQNNQLTTQARTIPVSVALLSNSGDINGENVSNNQIAFIKHQTGLTPAKAFTASQIAAVKRDYPDQLYDAVKKAILLTLMQFNVKDSMNSLQIELLTGDIINRYWYLKIDEIFYILKEGVAGKWKRPYNHIDGPTIHGWINQYETSERDALIERQTAEQKRLKPETLALPGSDETVRLLAMGYNVEATEQQKAEAKALFDKTQAAEQRRKDLFEAKRKRYGDTKPVTPEQYKTPEFIERLTKEAPEMNNETVTGLRILFAQIEATDALKIIDNEITRRKL